MKRLIGFMRVILATAVAVLLIICCTLCVCAEEDALDGEWGSFLSGISDDVKERFPDGSFEDKDSFASAVESMGSPEYIAKVLLDIIGIELGSAVRLFLVFCAVLLVSAVFTSFADAHDSPMLQGAVRFCSGGALISVIAYNVYAHFGMIEDFFQKLSGTVVGMIPMSAAVWAMGGNVSTASVGSASFSVMLGVCQALWGSTVIPVCSVLCVFCFCEAVCEEMNMSRITSAVKKIYNFILAFSMGIMLFSMSAQTAIAASADSVSARGAKLVSGSIIPIIGGSVGETLRTVASSVSYLKNVFGFGGIMLIAMLTLPVLVSVIMTRLVFMLSGGVAEVLGCKGEGKLLSGFDEIYGCMSAVLSGAAVMFVIALCIFMRTVVAVA